LEASKSPERCTVYLLTATKPWNRCHHFKSLSPLSLQPVPRLSTDATCAFPAPTSHHQPGLINDKFRREGVPRRPRFPAGLPKREKTFPLKQGSKAAPGQAPAPGDTARPSAPLRVRATLPANAAEPRAAAARLRAPRRPQLSRCH